MSLHESRPRPLPLAPPTDRSALEEYLAAFTNYETQRDLPTDRRALGPARCRALIDRGSGLPRRARVVQIAGSKGKGSTTLWLEALLRLRAESVVATLSPHLERLEERLRIDGRTATEEEFLGAIGSLHEALHAIDREEPALRPTFFDLMTAAAVSTAASRQSGWLLLEVGLGGPLDSTSAVPHQVGILTTVDLEHCAQLGETHAEIAAEKARIATAGAAFFIGSGDEQPKSALEAAEGTARSRGATVTPVANDERIPEAVTSPQRGNLALAIAALESQGLAPFTHAEVAAACERIALPARLELLPGPPPLLLDGAHTIASVEHFARRFHDWRAGRPGTVLVGAMHDKAWARAFLPLLADPEIRWIVTSAGGPRAADPAEIAASIASAGRPVETLPLEAAIQALREGIEGARGVTGSFHLAGAVRRAWPRDGEAPEVRPPRQTGPR